MVKEKLPVAPLEPFPQCMDCLTKLAQESAKLALGKNQKLRKEAETAGLAILHAAKGSKLNSPQIAKLILAEVRRRSGIPDPFKNFKVEEMRQARNIFAQVGRSIGGDLRSRLTLAALGNSLDFFSDPEEALSQIPDLLQRGLSFYYDDVDRLESFLSENPDLVLYLTDNSGEIYFDLPLYEYIKERTKRVVLVVKGGPSLNDLTRKELQLAHLEDRLDEVVDTGTDGAGIDWDNVSKEFLNLVERSDLLLSKGMANFETIFPRELTPAVFFLLKAKCRPVQNYLNAPPNSFLAMWKEGHLHQRAAATSS